MNAEVHETLLYIYICRIVATKLCISIDCNSLCFVPAHLSIPIKNWNDNCNFSYFSLSWEFFVRFYLCANFFISEDIQMIFLTNSALRNYLRYPKYNFLSTSIIFLNQKLKK